MSKTTGLLLAVLLFFLIAWAILYGGKVFIAKEKELTSQLTQLNTQVEGLSSVVGKSEFWQERKQWVDANLPEAKPDQTVRVEMSDLIQLPASASFVVKNPEFPEPDNESQPVNFKVARIRFKVTGQLDEVLPWLHGLIVKEKLLSISYLKIINNGSKEGDGEFSVELKKYYAKN